MASKPQPTRFFPFFFKLEGKKVLIVGGGNVATRKVKALLHSGARLIVVSPQLTPQLEKERERGRISIRGRKFRRSDLRGMAMVVVAVNDPELSRQIAENARQQEVPVNVVDQPALSSFIFPAVVERGALRIAIGTDGLFPGFARRLREELAQEFDELYAYYLELLASYRKKFIAAIEAERRRRQAMRDWVALPLLKVLRDKGKQAARQYAQRKYRQLVKKYQ